MSIGAIMAQPLAASKTVPMLNLSWSNYCLPILGQPRSNIGPTYQWIGLHSWANIGFTLVQRWKWTVRQILIHWYASLTIVGFHAKSIVVPTFTCPSGQWWPNHRQLPILGQPISNIGPTNQETGFHGWINIGFTLVQRWKPTVGPILFQWYANCWLTY